MVVAIDHIPENPPVIGAPQPIQEPVKEHLLTSEDFTDLFHGASHKLSEDRYDVLSTFLMSHEITAKIVFDFDGEHFARSVEQAALLRARLLADGVPADALSVRIKMNGKQGRILASFKRRAS